MPDAIGTPLPPKRTRHENPQQLHRSCSRPEQEPQEPETEEGTGRRGRKRRRRTTTPLSNDPQICLAFYIAMAHAGLAFSLALLFGIAKLLQGYSRPIYWAILCSMPLRELQTALVSFWSHPLNLGLFETLIAIPIAVLRVTTASLIDSYSAILRLLRRPESPRRRRPVGFAKLMQWLVSFGLFVVAHEHIGLYSVPAFTVPCLTAYTLTRGTRTNYGIASTLTTISSVRRKRRIVPANSLWSKINRYITSRMLNRLKKIAGIGLIAFMIIGCVFGFVFFSYKIGIEGKVAVISLKTHLEESNYAERMGLKKWMDENELPELIDAYTSKFYETICQNIDSFALYYNATEIVDGLRQYLTKPLHNPVNSTASEQVRLQSMSARLHYIQSRVKNREWKVIYRDMDDVFQEFISVIAREDLLEKIKAFVLQSLDVPKRVFASGTMVLFGSANMLFSVTVSIVSGAAGLLNVISEVMVFLWLLHYLVTSESGVMDHVLGMLPLSKSTRVRCAQVLDHAVSSVLLAAVKQQHSWPWKQDIWKLLH
ncbi:uncharacterized protein LOC131168669 isoform X2 [Malania oleifera]|uniref:uncharacterized protein LOC131168669 isoform X2 n=1 Tax=Malania oleifera TaxID=397392 RepID=UPI0025ADA592|nr:uncharacterized protein LOC131168669 isoform X2 [Malania oleifera]